MHVPKDQTEREMRIHMHLGKQDLQRLLFFPVRERFLWSLGFRAQDRAFRAYLATFFACKKSLPSSLHRQNPGMDLLCVMKEKENNTHKESRAKRKMHRGPWGVHEEEEREKKGEDRSSLLKASKTLLREVSTGQTARFDLDF